MNFKKLSLSLIILSISSTVLASECTQHFANGNEPAIINPKLVNRGHEVCYEAFSVYTSGVTRTAIWSAEHLTRDSLQKAAGLKRDNNFHTEGNIAENDRAELSDYSRSGYDRGHMSPNGDMPTKSAQYESFSLANMIPQQPQHNQGMWANIESGVREYTKEHGELYVVTGPAFIADANSQLDSLKGRVIIPTHVWKAIYDRQSNQAGVYWTSNINTTKYETISLAELKAKTGIDVFPMLSNNIKGKAMSLPEPIEHGQSRNSYHTSNEERYAPSAERYAERSIFHSIAHHYFR